MPLFPHTAVVLDYLGCRRRRSQWQCGLYQWKSYTVKGSGADIWGNHDSFQFVYQRWSGDGQIVVRVAGVQNTYPWAKAALMFRETLDDDSRNGILFVSPSSGVSMQSRTNTTGLTATVNTVAGAPPRWLALMRSGNVLYGYQSSDGITWTPVGTNTVPMANDIYVGSGRHFKIKHVFEYFHV